MILLFIVSLHSISDLQFKKSIIQFAAIVPVGQLTKISVSDHKIGLSQSLTSKKYVMWQATIANGDRISISSPSQKLRYEYRRSRNEEKCWINGLVYCFRNKLLLKTSFVSMSTIGNSRYMSIWVAGDDPNRMTNIRFTKNGLVHSVLPTF